MPSRAIMLGVVTTVAIGVFCVRASAQPFDPATARARLADSRWLEPAEMDGLLAAVRQAVGGRAFRLLADRGGFAADILFERDGHVRFVRTQVNNRTTFAEYTGRIARYCDGTIGAGELVVEYRQSDAGWTVNTRQSSLSDLLRPVFDMLVGLKPLVDEGLTNDGARAFSVGWNLDAALTRATRPGGGGAGASSFALADPTVSGVERLVIAPASLLPLRWEFTLAPSSSPSSGSTTFTYRFQYDADLVLAPPRTGVSPPDCVAIVSPFPNVR
jgi:hypothetical protein